VQKVINSVVFCRNLNWHFVTFGACEVTTRTATIFRHFD